MGEANEQVVGARPEQVRGRGQGEGRHPGGVLAARVPESGTGVQDVSQGRTGANPQNQEANSNRDAGERNQNGQATVVPFDETLHPSLVETSGELDIRAPDKGERSLIAAALRELSVAAGHIGHLFVFTKGKSSALFMGWEQMDRGAAIGLNARMLSRLNKKLFSDLPSQIRYILAHEAGHNLDLGKEMEAKMSSHPGFEMGEKGAVGALPKEMEAAAKNDAHPFYALLTHTPFKEAYAGRAQDAQLELFAQAYAMYTLHAKELQKHLPRTFAHMESLYGRYSGKRAGSADAGRTSGAGTAQQNTRQAVPKGSDARAGEGAGVSGRARGAVGDERDATGQRVVTAASAAKQLQAYLKFAQEREQPVILLNALKHALDLAQRGEFTPTVQGALVRSERALGPLPEEESTKCSRRVHRARSGHT